MSHNPMRNKAIAKHRQTDPFAGKRHSDYTRGHGPRGMNIEDMRNRQTTPHGWRISYFEGEQFEVFYEYFCARNGTGTLKNDEHDRVIRVLAGSLFITLDGQITTLRTNQAIAIPKGTEYELSSSAETDAELLVCQGPGYLDSVEQVSQPLVNLNKSMPSPNEPPPRSERVDPAKAKAAAAAARIARTAHQEGRNPVPGKKITNELGEAVPPPSHQRAPISGQQEQGANLKPVGAGGYSKD